MKLEQQVSSLEPSQKLRRLGVKQESLFYYNEFGDLVGDVFDNSWRADNWKAELISAFTISELGEMLPEFIERRDGTYYIAVHRTNGIWEIMYEDLDQACICTFHASTEADARAKMLIYLLENQLYDILK